jgi:hypothetical protein
VKKAASKNLLGLVVHLGVTHLGVTCLLVVHLFVRHFGVSGLGGIFRSAVAAGEQTTTQYRAGRYHKQAETMHFEALKGPRLGAFHDLLFSRQIALD